MNIENQFLYGSTESISLIYQNVWTTNTHTHERRNEADDDTETTTGFFLLSFSSTTFLLLLVWFAAAAVGVCRRVYFL